MHDLVSLTLENAIARHAGEAKQVERRFRSLTASEKATGDSVSKVAVEPLNAATSASKPDLSWLTFINVLDKRHQAMPLDVGRPSV
jgi:hypothetical protein